MMNSNSTSKIVVGIGLAVVFGLGASVFAVRAKHESELARNAPAPALATPAGQNSTDATAAAQSAAAQTPTDQPATPSSAPPAVPPVVAQTPVAPTAPTAPTPRTVAKDTAGTPASDESKPAKSKASDRADRHVAKTRNSGDTSATRVASAANSDSMKSNQELATAPPSSDTTTSALAGATADTQQVPAQSGQEAATGAGPAVTSNDPGASDSQITAQVKSEIATSAPNSNVNVTTTNGVVALAGSVPSQDAVDQARQAAQRVAGVKHVDASGLMVSNQ